MERVEQHVLVSLMTVFCLMQTEIWEVTTEIGYSVVCMRVWDIMGSLIRNRVEVFINLGGIHHFLSNSELTLERVVTRCSTVLATESRNCALRGLRIGN